MTDAEELAARVRDGELRLYELEEHADAETAATARRRLLAEETGVDLESIGDYTFEAADAEPNVENMIGAAQLPMGVVGPLPVDGSAADGEHYLPLATTEGALVASVNRGVSTIRRAGGATARVLKSGMTRAPVFRVEDVAAAGEVSAWVREHVEDLAEAAEATTGHGELQDVTPYVVGDNVFLRFSYDTKDAMGMNMATIATEAACEIVERETPAELVALSGNLCSDKKPAAINAVEGRGRTVAADVLIPHEQVEERLGTTTEAIAEANTRKNLVGSAKAGALGFNAHAANVVAAAFLATGQDAAQVVEGANAITTVDAREDGLYASVTLASLEVGTVGGGTSLPTQAEGLDVLGYAGGGDPAGSNADALAEVIAAGALAGELSLLAALSSRHLSSAHEDLGR
ncbi:MULTISPECIES: hydroxymethylglutaryl-CoA reductase (NADPH) [Halomicrobium]|uniref:3-hydroxy-3-methylglutaryl coenzyme A reductase n=2 Tax=Halomicrobium mukohataei TaxID=57705 RepID=C7P3E2_HALMD|nr:MULTISPECIES: hydroxymethylglutaryl-CoA reductase (NADPH) [Halomicrobium]ACV47614.1 3-hydroxy-3-methylglutaryl Coenzyme A reductase [Halomicrobium mukohataei DSM 12286]QCD66072.1 hydroxymethylglutaryl-CoA reductase (NADPH) [Halomicrobium mukohataei]QFR20877.1 hydroxymethylglutaryl-CoA reductase (NADPH) [Halomicrobium sp. ZPS1]